MPPSGEPASQTAKWVGLLSSPDAEERAVAAAALYLAANRLFLGATGPWMRDRDFRPLVVAPHMASAKKRVPPPRFIAGIAVEPATFERIHRANGLPRLANVPPDQDAKEFELAIGATYFDILTTREAGGTGAIAKFLQKFGEGIQQIEIYVRDVDRAAQILRETFSVQPIYPETRPGADGTRVNFFLAPAPEGKKVLIELVEAGGAARH